MAVEIRRAARWRRWGLRARLTVITVLVLAVALGAGGVLSVRLSDRALLSGSEEVARSRAAAFATVLSRIGIGRAEDEPITLRNTAGQLLQVVDDDGRPLLQTAGLEGESPLLNAERLARIRLGKSVLSRHPSLGPLLSVGAVGQRPKGGGFTVVFSVPVEDNVRSMDQIRTGVALGVPLLIVFLGGIVWVVVGRALRPVVALRQGAEEIAGLGGRDPGRHLPVPAAHDEIHDLATTLNAMLDRLNTAVARQRAFTADAAHELRSPLANVRTVLEVALAHPERQDWPQTAQDVLADIRRLTRLAEDLLALARLDTLAGAPAAGSAAGSVTGSVTGTGPVPQASGASGASGASEPAVGRRAGAGARDRPGGRRGGGIGAGRPERGGSAGHGQEAESASVADIATTVAERFRIARVPVTLDLPVAPVASVVDVPGYDLDRVLTNVIDNAVRHAASQVTVTVTTEPGHPGSAIVSVIDDGPGIAPADRDRVFERFTRLDDARDRDAGGAGLGLAIVAETVRRYGGRITLHDARTETGAEGGAERGIEVGTEGGTGLRAVIDFPLASPTGRPPGPPPT